jgi:hypothetical protein
LLFAAVVQTPEPRHYLVLVHKTAAHCVNDEAIRHSLLFNERVTLRRRAERFLGRNGVRGSFAARLFQAG